jgi:hypothetical protein
MEPAYLTLTPFDLFSRIEAEQENHKDEDY